MVQGEAFLTELNGAWSRFVTSNRVISEALLMELRAYPLAVEVAKAAATSPTESKGWLSKLFGRASTVAGSVKDLVENLPPLAKNALTLFKELVELFKSKD